MPDGSANRSFVFTATTGRSGTTYLGELLRANLSDASVYHERAGYLAFGVDSPDASHFTLFNSAGNVAPVQEFWRRKTARVLAETASWYIETSHLLLKAGLLENITPLTDSGKVTVIVLRRNIADTVISFVERHDFVNPGFTWLWTLDWNYPNKIVDPKLLFRHGAAGAALWYVVEMQARAEYYKLLLEGAPNLRFVNAALEDIAISAGADQLLSTLTGRAVKDAVVPGRANELRSHRLSEAARDNLHGLVRRTNFDPAALARVFFESGRRLGSGNPEWRDRFDRHLAGSS